MSWDLAATLDDILTDDVAGGLFETVYAHRAGFCARQLYLITLGLRSDSDWQGRFQTRRAMQTFLQEELKQARPDLEVAPRLQLNDGGITFVGRPTCLDRDPRTVFHLKPRNGWYRFNPPIQRHVDQLRVYMQAADALRGQLVYVSMADLTDTRTWPPEGDFLEPDTERFRTIVERARAVRDEIIQHGVATTTADIPFSPCGCYLCETEELALPTAADDPSVPESPRDDHASEPALTASYGGMSEVLYPSPDCDAKVLESDTRHVPRGLREHEIWVLWDTREKRPLAPWQSGHMYPCKWSRESGLDPRASYENATMVAELPVERIHENYPFPEAADLPPTVRPAVLLPHEPPDPPIVVLDLDDVRNPETGETSPAGATFIRDLGGYTELSSSGTGFHVFVRGELPGEGRAFSAPLGNQGRVEVYDRSRFVGSTWDHVTDTPLDDIPVAQDALDEIVLGTAT